jgi:multiple antibiotic resistance protein
MPIIAGPACLTATLVLSSRYGYGWTVISLLVNLAIVWVFLRFADGFARLLGTNTLRGISKLVMVLLAAIAVNYIRVGITQIIAGR